VNLTGPIGVTPGVASGGSTAAAAINAAGGINGHPVKFVACDLTGTPAGSQACGQKAVRAGAVATVMGQDGIGAAIPATNAAGIPSIANCACDQADSLLPTAYPTTTGPGSIAAQGQMAAALGAKTIAIETLDAAAGDTIISFVKAGLTSYGHLTVKTVKIPVTASDLSPYVAQLTSSDAVVLIGVPSTTLQLLRDLKQAGYPGKIVTSVAQFHVSDLKALGAAADGIYVMGGSLPASDPAAAAFNADLAKYGGPNALNDGYAIETWATMKLVAQVMKTIPGTVTPKNLTAALKAAGRLQIAPMVPVDFGKPLAAFTPVRDFSSSYYVLTVKNGQYTALSDTPYDLNTPPKSLP
jgi:ABC-type branched-subunit amino acid transport system substrate-binding protein